MIDILVVVAALTLLVLFLTGDYGRKGRFLRKFPGPRQLPLLGNALDVETSTDSLPKLQEFHRLYGGVIYLRLGPFIHSLIVQDVDSFEFFLSSTKIIDKSRSYGFMDRWLGQGLLTSTGSKWKSHRKILTPTFHFKILEEFIDVFNSVGEIFIKKLEKEVGKDLTDIYPYVTLCTLDIICETAMGVPVNAQSNSESEYVKSVKEMLRILIHRDRSLSAAYDFTYKLTSNYRSELKCLEVLHGFTEDVIRKRSLEIEQMGANQEEKNEFGIKKKQTFLDLMLRSKDADGKRALSDEEIREEVDTFMFEGHDTTGAAISFILHNIANHTEVQENIMKELNTIFENDKTRSATYNDLQEMKYLECVIKESLRIYPSVPIIGRTTTEDLEYEGKIIPKDTNIGIFIYGLHRDEKYFPDPLKFDPNRFLNVDKHHPYVFVPFSAGPRNCIGQKFAMLEMKATVSKVLRKYELLPAIPNDMPILVAEGVLKSANGINIRLKYRQ
nr:cytochrome P450 monooxygenase CYP4SS2 [Lasioderma serricorne]